MTIDQTPYATQPGPLRQQIDEALRTASEPEPVDGDIMALIVPDTNLVRGGALAGSVYQLLQGRTYDAVVLIAPTHVGAFDRITICSVDEYLTPLGSVPVSDRLRNELCDEDDDIYVDDKGHYYAAGVDVQLPYLQTVLEGFDVVPIVMGEDSPVFARELGVAVGEIMYNQRTLLVASADVLEASEGALDLLKEHLEALDVDHLIPLINGRGLTMRGGGALMVAVIAALHRRANKARMVAMQSPDDEGDGFIAGVVWRG